MAFGEAYKAALCTLGYGGADAGAGAGTGAAHGGGSGSGDADGGDGRGGGHGGGGGGGGGQPNGGQPIVTRLQLQPQQDGNIQEKCLKVASTDGEDAAVAQPADAGQLVGAASLARREPQERHSPDGRRRRVVAAAAAAAEAQPPAVSTPERSPGGQRFNEVSTTALGLTYHSFMDWSNSFLGEVGKTSWELNCTKIQ